MKVELPKLVTELEERIGLAQALKLVEAFGGARLAVPAGVGPEHPLARLLGLADAMVLCSLYPHENLSVPRCAALVRAKRDNEIRSRFDKGESSSKLALAFNLTDRHIWRILATADAELPEGEREDPRQRRFNF